jgi:hypothetical protein
MPKVCEFFGILINMYFDDHKPPHFHAIYGEYEALISIKNLKIIKGKLPPKIYNLVTKWVTQHQEELKRNWNKVINSKQPDKIKPLL